jgi:hypothetical protein
MPLPSPFVSSGLIDSDYIGRLRPSLTRDQVKLDLLSLSECLEPLGTNGREMNEYVLTVFLFDETVSLRVAEPLDAPYRHGPVPPWGRPEKP